MTSGNGNGNGISYEIIEPSRQTGVTYLDLVIAALQMIFRILLVIGIWLTLCFSVFLGFFTIPLLMLLAFSLIYALFDLYRVVRKAIAAKRKKTENDDSGNSAG